MCGRFVSSSPPDELARYFGAELHGESLVGPDVHPTPDGQDRHGADPDSASGSDAAWDGPDYNVAPSTAVFVVRSDGSSRRLERFRWGLVPSWAKDPAVGNRMINARVETLTDKPVFRRPLAKRRCLVPADGFYEWTAVPGQKKKQPWFIHRPDGEPFAFAGLWEVWRPPPASDGDLCAPRPWLRSCTIVTGPANEKMAPIHDRMPVMLPPSAWDTWLDPSMTDVAVVGRLLVPAPSELIAFHPVSAEVSNVRNNGAHLVEPIELPATLPGALGIDG